MHCRSCDEDEGTTKVLGNTLQLMGTLLFFCVLFLRRTLWNALQLIEIWVFHFRDTSFFYSMSPMILEQDNGTDITPQQCTEFQLVLQHASQ